MNNIYAVLIYNSKDDKDISQDDEFISLVLSSGYDIAFGVKQNVEIPSSATYLRKGIMEKIKEYIGLFLEKMQISNDNIIIATNFDLTGTQRANLKKYFDVDIIDRTFVILKIFENNARSKEAKLQVDIASLSWSRNHLINKEGAFSQVTSGGNHNKGSGEKKINLDKRHINLLIESKKRELERIKIARKNSREKRNNSPLYKIAVVGYTNAGKSTLINSFINFSNGEKTVLSKDELFATLETSTREIYKYGYMKFLLTDTVGFISNLPTTLVDAFRSTLEEIKEADMLLHVVDISNPNYKDQIKVTNEVLKEIGVNNIPTIYLYNKYDLVDKGLPRLLKNNEMYSSLISNNDIYEIYNFIFFNLSKNWKKVDMVLPFEEDYASFSRDNFILSTYKKEDGYHLTVFINPRTEHLYSYLIEKYSK